LVVKKKRHFLAKSSDHNIEPRILKKLFNSLSGECLQPLQGRARDAGHALPLRTYLPGGGRGGHEGGAEDLVHAGLLPIFPTFFRGKWLLIMEKSAENNLPQLSDVICFCPF
jgi:hypothetical protein